MELTTYGVGVVLKNLSADQAVEAAELAEQLGFGTLWAGGSVQLPAVRLLLTATERITIATGIVNIWSYDPAQLAAEFWAVEEEFPGRLLLGLGIGHRETVDRYAAPLTTMRTFLDGLATAERSVPQDRMVLAALGPKMLDLSRERTAGTHTHFAPPGHTRLARARIGPDALIAPWLTVVLEADLIRARARAREFVELRLQQSNYKNNLLRIGFTEDDLRDGGSDRLLDRVVPMGSPAQIAAAAREHLDAGADHICLQPAGVPGVPREAWRELAAELIGGRAA